MRVTCVLFASVSIMEGFPFNFEIWLFFALSLWSVTAELRGHVSVFVINTIASFTRLALLTFVFLLFSCIIESAFLLDSQIPRFSSFIK
jgi:hypothetical protein